MLLLLHPQRLLSKEVLPPYRKVHPTHIYFQDSRSSLPVKHIHILFPLFQDITPNRNSFSLESYFPSLFDVVRHKASKDIALIGLPQKVEQLDVELKGQRELSHQLKYTVEVLDKDRRGFPCPVIFVIVLS